MNNKKFLAFFIPGIILAVSTPALSRYLDLPDNLMGLIAGFGIGLLLLSIIIKIKQVKAISK